MNGRLTTAIIVILTSAACLLTCKDSLMSAQEQEAKAVGWEYETVALAEVVKDLEQQGPIVKLSELGAHYEEFLNQRDREGWEYCGCLGEDNWHIVFRRKR